MSNQYLCKWYEPGYDFCVRTVGREFFSEVHGYDADAQAQIDRLTECGIVQFDCHTITLLNQYRGSDFS